MMLADGSFFSQMMLLAGMIMLAWILIRRNLKMRQRSRVTDREVRQMQRKAVEPPRGAPLADAPPDVLKWQSAMFELQRDLKAELDTKILVVETLLRQADQTIDSLERVTGSEAQKANKTQAQTPDTAGTIRNLAAAGYTASEISDHVKLPLGEVELQLSITNSSLGAEAW